MKKSDRRWLDKRLTEVESQSPPGSINYHDYEFIEVFINGEQLPPGNVFEVLLPDSSTPCFRLRGNFNGKETLLWCTGNIKLVALRKGDADGIERRF